MGVPMRMSRLTDILLFFVFLFSSTKTTMSSPVLFGLRPDSTIKTDKTVVLTCTTTINALHQTRNVIFYWKVNGQFVFQDGQPLEISNLLVSNFQYTPEKGDGNVECVVNNEKGVARLDFIVENRKPQLVKLQKIETSRVEKKQPIWIPYDVSNKNSIKVDADEDLSKKKVEHRNIYEVMEFQQSFLQSATIGSKYQNRNVKYQNRNNIVELLEPRTLALVSKGCTLHIVNSMFFIFLLILSLMLK